MEKAFSIQIKLWMKGIFNSSGNIRTKKVSIEGAAIIISLVMLACSFSTIAQGTEPPPTIGNPSETSATATQFSPQTPFPTATQGDHAAATPHSQKTQPPSVTLMETETATSTVNAPAPSPVPDLLNSCEGAPATISPDGKWVFCDAIEQFSGATRAYFVSASGTKWNVSYKNILGPIIYYGYHKVFYWTSDDHYVYVAPWPGKTGSPREFPAGFDLWRMDLTSGNIKGLIADGQTPYSDSEYAIALSPKGEFLAYVHQWQYTLKLDIVNLTTGEKKELQIADYYSTHFYATAGELIWTEGGQRLIYKIIYAKDMTPCTYTYSIKILNLTGMTTATIVDNLPVTNCGGENAEYRVLQVDNHQVILVLNSATWRYDIAARTMKPLTSATPTP